MRLIRGFLLSCAGFALLHLSSFEVRAEDAEADTAYLAGDHTFTWEGQLIRCPMGTIVSRPVDDESAPWTLRYKLAGSDEEFHKEVPAELITFDQPALVTRAPMRVSTSDGAVEVPGGTRFLQMIGGTDSSKYIFSIGGKWVEATASAALPTASDRAPAKKRYLAQALEIYPQGRFPRGMTYTIESFTNVAHFSNGVSVNLDQYPLPAGASHKIDVNFHILAKEYVLDKDWIPVRKQLPAGTQLQIRGTSGDFFRVKLDDGTNLLVSPGNITTQRTGLHPALPTRIPPAGQEFYLLSPQTFKIDAGTTHLPGGQKLKWSYDLDEQNSVYQFQDSSGQNVTVALHKDEVSSAPLLFTTQNILNGQFLYPAGTRVRIVDSNASRGGNRGMRVQFMLPNGSWSTNSAFVDPNELTNSSYGAAPPEYMVLSSGHSGLRPGQPVRVVKEVGSEVEVERMPANKLASPRTKIIRVPKSKLSAVVPSSIENERAHEEALEIAEEARRIARIQPGMEGPGQQCSSTPGSLVFQENDPELLMPCFDEWDHYEGTSLPYKRMIDQFKAHYRANREVLSRKYGIRNENEFVEIQFLSRTLLSEASYGQNYMLAVGAVIRNRVLSSRRDFNNPDFPAGTYVSVVTRKRQYSGWWSRAGKERHYHRIACPVKENRTAPRVMVSEIRKAFAAALQIYSGMDVGIPRNVYHFFTPSLTPKEGWKPASDLPIPGALQGYYFPGSWFSDFETGHLQILTSSSGQNISVNGQRLGFKYFIFASSGTPEREIASKY